MRKRILFLAVGLSTVACTGAPQVVEVPGGSGGEPERRGAGKMPAQVAPAPVQVELATLATWSGSSWALADGRTLTVGDESITLGEETLQGVLQGGGGPAGDRIVRLVGPCSVAVHEDGVWVEGVRERPACTAEEARVAPTLHVTWRMPGGDFYTFLPGNKVWRRGPKRVFKRPVGELETPEGAPAIVSFGPSVYDVHPLDPCHRVFALRDPDNAYRAQRTFPACPSELATYDGLAWTLWEMQGGHLLDLREIGRAEFDPSDEREVFPATWSLADGGLTFESRGRTLSLSIDGCRGTVTEEGQPDRVTQRTYPACPAAEPAEPAKGGAKP